MSEDIIDFNKHKERKDIDAHLVLDMPDGTTWFKYGANYAFEGAELGFSIDFWAMNNEDAEKRIKAIKNSLKLEGKIYSEGEM